MGGRGGMLNRDILGLAVQTPISSKNRRNFCPADVWFLSAVPSHKSVSNVACLRPHFRLLYGPRHFFTQWLKLNGAARFRHIGRPPLRSYCMHQTRGKTLQRGYRCLRQTSSHTSTILGGRENSTILHGPRHDKENAVCVRSSGVPMFPNLGLFFSLIGIILLAAQ